MEHRLLKRLQESGLKATHQRLAMLRVLEMLGHGNVDEIYEALVKEYPTVSLATVYKNLLHLQEAELVRDINTPTSKPMYELVQEPHAHLLCSDCGAIEDLPYTLDENLAQAITAAGFQKAGEHLTITGRCVKCRERDHSITKAV